MDHHIKDYYQESSDAAPHGNFHQIIPLHNAPDVSWEVIHAQVPQLFRGWYELAQLPTKDRIEFTHDFWIAKLPYRAGLTESLDRFFGSLDDIEIFITQKKFDDPHEIEMVYSLKGNRGFYRGQEPITDKKSANLQKYFADFILPADYLAFLQIHDGFCKATDSTGVTKSENMAENYEKLGEKLRQEDPIMTSKGTMVNPTTLIPFYESFGMPFYQCFWDEWYPENEMGNVYYSGEAKTISDAFSNRGSAETMAFPSFSDWLMFYLERIE